MTTAGAVAIVEAMVPHHSSRHLGVHLEPLRHLDVHPGVLAGAVAM